MSCNKSTLATIKSGVNPRLRSSNIGFEGSESFGAGAGIVSTIDNGHFVG